MNYVHKLSLLYLDANYAGFWSVLLFHVQQKGDQILSV